MDKHRGRREVPHAFVCLSGYLMPYGLVVIFSMRFGSLSITDQGSGLISVQAFLYRLFLGVALVQAARASFL